MTIYAFTEPHNDYPALINLSAQKDNMIRIRVRTRGNGGKEYASIELAAAQAEELATSIYKHTHKDKYDTASQPEAPALTDAQIIAAAVNSGLAQEDGDDLLAKHSEGDDISGKLFFFAMSIRALLSAPVQAAVEPPDMSHRPLTALRGMAQNARLIDDEASPDAQAIRDQALEDAAKVCEGRIGGAIQSAKWWEGFKSAMKQCAIIIRTLKSQAPQPAQVKDAPASLTSREGEVRRAEADERELFEQWRKSDYPNTWHMTSEELDKYEEGAGAEADGMWIGWQARVALAQSPARQPDIKSMVDRFLGWKLPEDFAPDCGISFKREGDYDHPQHGRHKFEPIGTNLFHAGQAKAMFEYCLAAPQQGETK